MSKKSDCPVVIPYYGGKYMLSKQFVPLIPPHHRYFEVFSGGLSMFFRKDKANYIDGKVCCENCFWMQKQRNKEERASKSSHNQK